MSKKTVPEILSLSTVREILCSIAGQMRLTTSNVMAPTTSGPMGRLKTGLLPVKNPGSRIGSQLFSQAEKIREGLIHGGARHCCSDFVWHDASWKWMSHPRPPSNKASLDAGSNPKGFLSELRAQQCSLQFYSIPSGGWSNGSDLPQVSKRLAGSVFSSSSEQDKLPPRLSSGRHGWR